MIGGEKGLRMFDIRELKTIFEPESRSNRRLREII
jgi:hypothetical protein